jgi:L-2-hydroxyglutarate oxidase LhgO
MTEKRKRKKTVAKAGSNYSMDGKVTGGVVVMGPDAQVKIAQNTGVSAAEMTRMFDAVFQHIQSRPDNPDVDKSEIEATVQNIQQEAAKDEKANQSKVERWLKYLAGIAPDVVDVMAASLGGPVTGFTAVFKKILDKARQEA